MTYPENPDHLTGSLSVSREQRLCANERGVLGCSEYQVQYGYFHAYHGNMSLSQAFTCKKGGFVSNRQNDIRNITTNLLNEVCKDVCVEPVLAPLSGESIIPKSANTSADARVDITCKRSVDHWLMGILRRKGIQLIRSKVQ